MEKLSKAVAWQPLNAELLPANLQAWLSCAGSFVERLKAHGVRHPEIRPLRQRWRFPSEEEMSCLGIDAKSFVLAREVIIESGEKKWMYACTIFPARTLSGELKKLAHLKNKSLGSVLFKDPDLQRSQFEVMCFAEGMPEHRIVTKHVAHDTSTFWARRSLFTIQQKSLLLTEVFLPDIESLC